jgi:ribosome biogenesis ATPase
MCGCADEIDAIAAKRETAQREMERRIVAQMLTCMDDLSEQPLAGGTDGEGGTERGDPSRLPKHVVVIGAVALLDLSPGLSEADL